MTDPATLAIPFALVGALLLKQLPEQDTPLWRLYVRLWWVGWVTGLVMG